MASTIQPTSQDGGGNHVNDVLNQTPESQENPFGGRHHFPTVSTPTMGYANVINRDRIDWERAPRAIWLVTWLRDRIVSDRRGLRLAMEVGLRLAEREGRLRVRVWNKEGELDLERESLATLMVGQSQPAPTHWAVGERIRASPRVQQLRTELEGVMEEWVEVSAELKNLKSWQDERHERTMKDMESMQALARQTRETISAQSQALDDAQSLSWS